VVNPNNPDHVFFDTFEFRLASRTGTTWYDLTCGYTGNPVSNHVVHVDRHALTFVNGSSGSGGSAYWLDIGSSQGGNVPALQVKVWVLPCRFASQTADANLGIKTHRENE